MKVLGQKYSFENEQAILELLKMHQESVLVKYIGIQIFARWKQYSWLSDKKSTFNTMNTWERRLFIIASYVLGDEGKHWRDHYKIHFNEYEKIVSVWMCEKTQISTWGIPL